MEGGKKIVRVVPNCYNPKQDISGGIIHFIDEDDILLDYDFAEEYVCSQCWCRRSEDCEEELCGIHCIRHEIVDKIRFSVKLMNAAMTDLTFGLWKGTFEDVMKDYAGNNNS